MSADNFDILKLKEATNILEFTKLHLMEMGYSVSVEKKNVPEKLEMAK